VNARQKYAVVRVVFWIQPRTNLCGPHCERFANGLTSGGFRKVYLFDWRRVMQRRRGNEASQTTHEVDQVLAIIGRKCHVGDLYAAEDVAELAELLLDGR
jgi:hypothetical protein